MGSTAEDSPFARLEFCYRNHWHADEHHGFKLSFSRDPGGRLTVLDVAHSVVFDFWREEKVFDFNPLVRQLAQLAPDALTRFTLHPSPGSPVQPSQKDRETLRTALARFTRLDRIGT
jgi:hypothetical protein